MEFLCVMSYDSYMIRLCRLALWSPLIQALLILLLTILLDLMVFRIGTLHLQHRPSLHINLLGDFAAATVAAAFFYLWKRRVREKERLLNMYTHSQNHIIETTGLKRQGLTCL